MNKETIKEKFEEFVKESKTLGFDERSGDFVEVLSFIEKLIQQERERIIEEIKKLKVISPNVEPPKNKLSQNQIFIAGQMNVFMRLEDIIKNIK